MNEEAEMAVLPVAALAVEETKAVPEAAVWGQDPAGVEGVTGVVEEIRGSEDARAVA